MVPPLKVSVLLILFVPAPSSSSSVLTLAFEIVSEFPVDPAVAPTFILPLLMITAGARGHPRARH